MNSFSPKQNSKSGRPIFNPYMLDTAKDAASTKLVDFNIFIKLPLSKKATKKTRFVFFLLRLCRW